jgi:hypothetical protein
VGARVLARAGGALAAPAPQALLFQVSGRKTGLWRHRHGPVQPLPAAAVVIAGTRLQEPAMKGALAWLIGIPIPIIIILYLLDVF